MSQNLAFENKHFKLGSLIKNFMKSQTIFSLFIFARFKEKKKAANFLISEVYSFIW